jgi:hypothetical protein
MKDMLLFLSVMAVIICGFWLMTRLVRFLEEVDTSEDEDSESQ